MVGSQDEQLARLWYDYLLVAKNTYYSQIVRTMENNIYFSQAQVQQLLDKVYHNQYDDTYFFKPERETCKTNLLVTGSVYFQESRKQGETQDKQNKDKAYLDKQNKNNLSKQNTQANLPGDSNELVGEVYKTNVVGASEAKEEKHFNNLVKEEIKYQSSIMSKHNSWNYSPCFPQMSAGSNNASMHEDN